MSNNSPETGSFFARDREWHPPAFTPWYKTSILRSPQKALISLDNTISEITGPTASPAAGRDGTGAIAAPTATAATSARWVLPTRIAPMIPRIRTGGSEGSGRRIAAMHCALPVRMPR